MTSVNPFVPFANEQELSLHWLTPRAAAAREAAEPELAISSQTCIWANAAPHIVLGECRCGGVEGSLLLAPKPFAAQRLLSAHRAAKSAGEADEAQITVRWQLSWLCQQDGDVGSDPHDSAVIRIRGVMRQNSHKARTHKAHIIAKHHPLRCSASGALEELWQAVVVCFNNETVRHTVIVNVDSAVSDDRITGELFFSVELFSSNMRYDKHLSVRAGAAVPVDDQQPLVRYRFLSATQRRQWPRTLR